MYTFWPLVPGTSSFEAETVIEKLKRYPSSGIGQIPADLIQAAGNTLRFEIYKLNNYIFLNNFRSRIRAVLLYLFKKTGYNTGCITYRGISCLPTTYKMSRILLSRLLPHVKGITGNRQCEFRRDTSSIDQTLCLRQIME
jgi:hypothetical protein